MTARPNSDFFLRTLATTVSAAALCFVMPAAAQEAPEEDNEAVLETITVTAQKVEQNAQDIPVSVSAVSGATLEANGAATLENIGSLIPSVTFRKGTTNANSALVMRGVGTISFSIAAEPSVSTVVDGIVLSRSGQSFIDLVDVERIEALRGPQGTLFGKNASAGLVSIVSKGGSDTPEGELRAEYFEGEEYRLRGSIAGPLGEGLSGRLTGFYGEYDGNINNVVNGQKTMINGYERQGVRGLLDFDGAGGRYRFIADYFESNDDCCAEVTGVSRGAILDAELGFANRAGIETRSVSHNLITESLDQQMSLTASAEYDVLTGHTLNFIAGWRNWQNTELREGDFLPRATVTAGELHDRGYVETDQFSGEVRLASDQANAFRYQVGGFLWRSENAQDFTRRDITCTTSTLPVDPRTGARPCNIADTVNTLFPTATSRSDVTVDNYAVFGQADFDLTDALTLTAGLRWTNDEIDYTHTRAPGRNATTGLPATGPGISGAPAGGLLTATPPGNGTNTSAGSSENDNFSGKVALTYDITDDVMVYGSYTRGYKGPAFNVFFNHTAPINAVPIDEEVSDGYEVGFKSRFADDKAQLNLTFFDITYEDFQANNFVLLNNAVVSNLTNAGSVSSSGFELDFTARASEELTLFTSIANADAKVKRFNPNPLTNAPDARNGTKLPLAPEWSYNLGADFERDLGALRVYANALYSFTGEQFSDLGQSGPIESSRILDASIGFSDADDRYRLTFHGRNLGNVPYVLLNTSAGQRYHIPRDADAYWGVSLRARMF